VTAAVALVSAAALGITGVLGLSGASASSAVPARLAGVPDTSSAVVPFGSAAELLDPSDGASGPATSATATTQMPRELVVPDVLAVIPTGIPAADVAKIRKLSGVRGVLTVSGGAIKIGGKPANVIGVSPGQFRSWTPVVAAGDQAIWTALSHGQFVAGQAAQRTLGAGSGGLAKGRSYPVTAASQIQLTFGGATGLGIPGVDAMVNATVAARLGLVKDLAVLINAPADHLTSLVAQVRAVTGARSQVVSLQPTTATKPGQLPVDTSVPSGRPTTYLQLYQESAARYCPALSWTVLAAIGEVESGNGANEGPSSAGALGPMQFMPSTWTEWGIDGFGDTGTPDIMNPFDAVPSAAEMLCADGAAQGGSGLQSAIFAYNHADWYVSEVLAIAREYATGA
jgi:Transglycosylase SLT domain